jgi:HSP20 family protein
MTALQRVNGGALARPPFSLIDEMLRDFGNVGFARAANVFLDDMQERDDAYVITCDVPGVDAKDIELSIEGDTVSVRAERKSARNTTLIEHTYTVSGVDAARADACCDKGVLTVTLPKAESAKKRTIPVRLPEPAGDASKG